jgi:RNA-splicing ligase RtcB
MIDQVEPECVEQIKTFLDHEAFTQPVAIMPDTHAGKGSVIGFTMMMTDKVIPNVVGVDVGCGVCSVNIGKAALPELPVLDNRIRQRVPMGFEVNERKLVSIDDFPWKDFRRTRDKIGSLFGFSEGPSSKEGEFMDVCERVGSDVTRTLHSVGSLGGGNHFIEIGRDDDGNAWITIHTGSRNFGLRVADYWQGIAAKRTQGDSKAAYKEEAAKIKAEFMGRARGEKLKALKEKHAGKTTVPEGLEFLTDDDAVGYMRDMAFAQAYADWNREVIIRQILDALGVKEQDRVSSVHNLIDFDDMTIRKGAIRSYAGERMVIPFNMRDGLLICEGKSNPEWNNSAPHGAGRVLSRSAAMRQLSLDDVKDQMSKAGVFTTNIPLDEAPGAYKDSKVIEEAIKPTAKIIARIKPIHNMKA